MKLTKTLVIPVAGLLVALGAGAVLATSAPAAAPGGAAVVPAAESPTPAASGTPTRPDLKDTLLSDVLDNLVADGTITADQKTAILDALEAERTARITERQQAAQQLRDFLSDGQITQDELDQLAADSRLRQLTTLMDDGKITTEELQALGRGFLGGFGGGMHGFGHGFGPGGKGGWFAPDASPAPSPSTGTGS